MRGRYLFESAAEFREFDPRTAASDVTLPVLLDRRGCLARPRELLPHLQTASSSLPTLSADTVALAKCAHSGYLYQEGETDALEVLHEEVAVEGGLNVARAPQAVELSLRFARTVRALDRQRGLLHELVPLLGLVPPHGRLM